MKKSAVRERTFAVLAVTAWVCLSGCRPEGPASLAARPTETASELPSCRPPPGSPRHVVALFLDRSGSVGDLEPLRAVAAGFVESLPSNTLLVVRYLAGCSDCEEEFAFSVVLPGVSSLSGCPPTNPFDLTAKRRCARLQEARRFEQQCYLKARHQAAERIQALPHKRAAETDVGGGLLAAGELFESLPSGCMRVALFVSDLVDTRKRRLPRRIPGLRGATVVVRRWRPSARDEAEWDWAAFRDAVERSDAKLVRLARGVPGASWLQQPGLGGESGSDFIPVGGEN